MFCTVLFIRAVHFCVKHLLFSPKCRIIYYRYFRLWKNLYRYQKMGCRVLLALLVLHRAKLLASNQSILALGRSPQQGLGAVAPHSAPARMPGVYAQGLCTMQSQPSIHSLSRGKGGRGIGIINQKFISKTDFFCKLKEPCLAARLFCFFTLNTICN